MSFYFVFGLSAVFLALTRLGSGLFWSVPIRFWSVPGRFLLSSGRFLVGSGRFWSVPVIVSAVFSPH